MKKIIYISNLALMILSFSHIAHAYKYTFTNESAEPLELRIKLSGINEPWYQVTLQKAQAIKGSSYTFDFNPGKRVFNADNKAYEYTGRKLFFCLSDIQIAPWVYDKNNKLVKSDHWQDIPPTFIENEQYNKLIQAIADTTKDGVQQSGTLMEAVSKYGMSLAAERAGAALKNMDLSEMVKAIGELISTSACKDRSFAIYKNIDKDLKFKPGYIIITNAR